MRLLVIGCFALWVAAVAAQAPRTLTDHPATQAPATGRSDASTLTEKLRPSTGAPSTATAIARSSDEEFFRRVHIDLTGAYFLNDIYKPHSNRVGMQGKVAFQNAFHYIEPFAARLMIRSQEITPLFA